MLRQLNKRQRWLAIRIEVLLQRVRAEVYIALVAVGHCRRIGMRHILEPSTHETQMIRNRE